MTSQETNNAPAENTQPTENTQSNEPRTPRARPPRSKPESGSRAPRPPRERAGYFAGKDPKPNSGPDKLEPGASFITIPKFRNKRSFPFITPQQALKKHLGYEELRVTPTPKDVLRVIPFGGVEQVGLNCTGFEYNGEVLIIDMGLQFADQYQHGISCSIPDLSYVKGKKVAGIVITHGHIDHIGAVPYAVKQLGKNIPTYATSMAYELIAMKQAENNATMTNLERINRNVPIQIGENF